MPFHYPNRRRLKGVSAWGYSVLTDDNCWEAWRPIAIHTRHFKRLKTPRHINFTAHTPTSNLRLPTAAFLVKRARNTFLKVCQFTQMSLNLIILALNAQRLYHDPPHKTSISSKLCVQIALNLPTLVPLHEHNTPPNAQHQHDSGLPGNHLDSVSLSLSLSSKCHYFQHHTLTK